MLYFCLPVINEGENKITKSKIHFSNEMKLTNNKKGRKRNKNKNGLLIVRHTTEHISDKITKKKLFHDKSLLNNKTHNR